MTIQNFTILKSRIFQYSGVQKQEVFLKYRKLGIFCLIKFPTNAGEEI